MRCFFRYDPEKSAKVDTRREDRVKLSFCRFTDEFDPYYLVSNLLGNHLSGGLNTKENGSYPATI